jgi:probable H4MPT-linked C1 transfer pathway protein
MTRAPELRRGDLPLGDYVLGVDIGGANLKYVAVPASTTLNAQDQGSLARSRSYPLWLRHESLADDLVDDLRSFVVQGSIESLAITMTGELADCFLDRREGVQRIVSCVCQAANQLGIKALAFYGVDGTFHDAESACEQTDNIAAANWHALAAFVGQTHCRDGVLIDIGSTTTDIIPIRNGQVATVAKTDHERLVEGSLVYLGGRRTPVAMMVQGLQYNGQRSTVMNEVFATMDDVRLVLKMTDEDLHDCDTADHRARTIPMAVNRLARMIGLDWRTVSAESAMFLASQIHAHAVKRIVMAVDGIRPLSGDANAFVISGHASDLFSPPRKARIVHLSDCLGHEVSRCAPAFAVAQLFRSLR